MPAPKTLDQHVVDGTFRARRHHEMLVGPVVRWEELAQLQARYAAATSEAERRAIGVAFERAAHALDFEETPDPIAVEVDAILALPPVPLRIAGDEAATRRYFRAIRIAGAALDAKSDAAAAATVGVSR